MNSQFVPGGPCEVLAFMFQAMALKSHIEGLLQLVKQSHYITADDQSWVDFLLKAVDHNNNKLQPLLTL